MTCISLEVKRRERNSRLVGVFWVVTLCAVWWCRLPSFRGTMLKMYAASSPKRRCPTTLLHDVTTWNWRQQGPPKRRYPTISLHGVTTWRWRQQVLRNVGVLLQRYMTSQLEDGDSSGLRNVGILQHHFTSLQPRRLRLESFLRCENLKSLKLIAVPCRVRTAIQGHRAVSIVLWVGAGQFISWQLFGDCVSCGMFAATVGGLTRLVLWPRHELCAF
jgi:hypothetical protein